ncbi:MAG TPA: ATP-binding protein [Bryobacteraceae bacterium]|nr:ATP-binding protein [Bryobacteraceae bacterium]
MSWFDALNPRRTLRRQLIATVIGVHTILMMSFVWDLVDRQQRFLLERARSRSVHQAELLATSAVPQLITHDFSGMQEVLESLARDRWDSASVTDTSGRIVGHSDARLVGSSYTDERSRWMLTGPHKARTVYETETRIRAAAPVIVEQTVLGWAWVTADLTADRAEIAKLRNTGLIYFGIAIISGATFAIMLGTALTRQLRLLLAGTQRLAEDNFNEPVPIIAENDVGQVAEAFNTAMQKLRAQRSALMQAHEGLRAANQAILSANESLRRFAYAASHDLQEPLRTVSGYSELLHDRYSGALDADATEFIDYIHNGATRMQNLLKALLEYSRAGPRGEPARVDANTALRTALEHLEVAIKDSNAAVNAATLPLVWAHEVAVVQLFQNLIGNAIKYAGDKAPVVHVWAERDAGSWRFAVKDEGPGIDPRNHERIFGIFKRAHGPEYPGTGVGLAICTRIVEGYGGRIWVESTLGRGATFWFTLPAADAPDTRDSAHPNQASLVTP